MEAKVLAKKHLDSRSWYLCEVNLYDYVKELKEDFYSFAIQRKIVKNIYLDKLFQTIKSGDPIPVITLVSDKELEFIDDSSSFHIDMENLEILDGLQRTFRLWAYWKLAQHYKKNANLKDFTVEIKTKYSILFETGVVSTRTIRELFDSKDIKQIENIYKEFTLYFIIWTNLTDTQIVDKMLSLNAGQKSVTKVHQYELLFLHYYTKMSDNKFGINLVREKDENYNNIRKGDRKIGDFLFSSVMVSLHSLIEQKPIRISINTLALNPEMEEYPSDYLINSYFSRLFLNCFMQSMRTFDEKIIKSDEKNGKKWFVKDTTLSGFFAAIGKNMPMTKGFDPQTQVDYFVNTSTRLQEVIDQKGLNLVEFDKLYSEISGKSMNIGNFIRKAVFDYIDNLIVHKEASWKTSFKSGGVGADNDQ